MEKADEVFTALLSGKEKSAGSEETPGLDDVAGEVSALYTQVGQVDAAPTVAQQNAAEHVERRAEYGVLQAWERLKGTCHSRVESQTQREHLPTLDLESKA